MAFCANCGSQVSGAFCPNCGNPMAAASPGMGPIPQTGPAPAAVAASGLEPHIAAALCYTPFAVGLICSIIFLLIEPMNKNKFVRFSAFQSLFLHLGLFVLGIVLGVVMGIITAIVHAFGLMFVALGPIIWLAVIVLLLFMMYKAFNNQTIKLPIIGDLAQKQA